MTRGLEKPYASMIGHCFHLDLPNEELGQREGSVLGRPCEGQVCYFVQEHELCFLFDFLRAACWG